MTDSASFATPESPIVVVGGSLAGMAVAARLAYRGHHVVLLEATPHLGGHHRTTGIPPVIELPAVWRDLFTKSGRALDAVLTTRGYEWTPAPEALHRFADGSEISWPTNRGHQARVITDSWGPEAAQRWSLLLDGLRDIWQALRPLGFETETTPAAWRAAKRSLVPPGFKPGATVADLAAWLRQPQLAVLVLQVAWQHGQHPNRLPAHHAFRLATPGIFGRWLITGTDGSTAPTDLLPTLLAERLTQRGVEIVTDSLVQRIRDSTVHTTDRTINARAVIGAVTPDRWVELTRPGRWHRVDREIRHLARPGWANAPQVVPSNDSLTGEIINHPARTITDPIGSSWSWTDPNPQASAGPAWTSARTWHDLTGPRLGPHYLVGSHTRAGTGTTGELFSAALAAYAVHADLTGEDIHPSNRNQPPRPRRRPGGTVRRS